MRIQLAEVRNSHEYRNIAMFNIEVQNQQSLLTIDGDAIRSAVESILDGEGVEAAAIQVAIVDDPTIHDLNRRFLDHDEPTDVLSFPLAELPEVDGCLAVSADTAARAAAGYGWSASEELLLYIVHGTLHLVGYDDLSPKLRAEMRAKERHYLALAGLQPRYDEADEDQESATAGSSSNAGGGFSEGVRP